LCGCSANRTLICKPRYLPNLASTHPCSILSPPTFLLFFSLSLEGGGVNIPPTPVIFVAAPSSSEPDRSTNSSAVSTLPMERFRPCRIVDGPLVDVDVDADERRVVWFDCLFLVDLRVGVEVDMALPELAEWSYEIMSR
jgi:hypothetical protein